MPSESFGKKRTNEPNLVCKNCLPKKAKNSRNQTAAEQGISTLSLDEAYERLPSSDLNATVVVDPDDPVLQPIRHIEYVDDRSTLLPHVLRHNYGADLGIDLFTTPQNLALGQALLISFVLMTLKEPENQRPKAVTEKVWQGRLVEAYYRSPLHTSPEH